MEKLKEIGVLMFSLTVAFYIVFVGLAGVAHADNCKGYVGEPTLDLYTFLDARCETDSVKIDAAIKKVLVAPNANQIVAVGLASNKNLTVEQKTMLLTIRIEDLGDPFRDLFRLKLGLTMANAD